MSHFVLRGAVMRLVHLNIGLAMILAFIGVKLGLAHLRWEAVPGIPPWSGLVLSPILAVSARSSPYSNRRVEAMAQE